MAKKAPDAFRTISEVADWLGVSPHVLRFWESKFSQVKPVKRAGGRRYYRPADMELLGGIRKLLHDDGLTVKAVQQVLKEQGVKAVSAMSHPVETGADENAQASPAIFKAPSPRTAPTTPETIPQKDASSLPLFSDSLRATGAEPGAEVAGSGTDASEGEAPMVEDVAPAPETAETVPLGIADPGIAEPAGLDSQDAGAKAKPSGPVIAPLPELPSAASDPVEPAKAPQMDAPTPPPASPVIAPLPEQNLSLTERLTRLPVGQIPAAQLAPLHARLVALRARMNER